MAKTVTTTVTKSDESLRMRIFKAFIGAAAFCTLYVTLFSALPLHPSYYAALPIGVAAVAAMLVFSENKFVRWGIVGAALLFTVLSVAAGFTVFRNGSLEFFNAAIESLNANRHYGFASFAAESSAGADFLFAANVAMWFAVFTAFSVKKQYVFICAEAMVIVVLMCLGLYPHYSAGFLIVLVIFGLLAIHNGFTLRAIIAVLVCAFVVCTVTIPCYFYGGSDAVKGVGVRISDTVQNVLYGRSLPNGNLRESGGIRASDKLRLKLTASSLTPSLYLKGFVGSDFKGSYWATADKNVYVQNGHQGLLEYISEAGIPVKQYAEYTKLNGENASYSLTVENVSADKRYIYAPYSLSEYGAGEVYYDSGLRGGVFSPDTYTHTIFAADESSERFTQAEWLMPGSSRSVAMEEYIGFEEQYRAFVYDVYLSLDEESDAILNGVIGDFSTTSVNTAAQFIRSYFLGSFEYSDDCDGFDASFADDFFGGKIERADSAYFATAATLMFRKLGFASRYVEGYFVRFDGTDEAVSVDVTDESAHAWSEVYFDGAGWLPIEVTPTFFSEQPPDATVAPEGGDDTLPSNPEEQPEAPDENTKVPEKPDDKKPNNYTVTVEKPNALLTALRVLVPIVSVLAFVLLVMVFFAFRLSFVRAKRRKALSADGEKFGRAAYGILERDCRAFGAFDSAVLEGFGVSANATARFMRIAERSVFGAHSLSEADRDFVFRYIGEVQHALLSGCGFFRRTYYKYIQCIVI